MQFTGRVYYDFVSADVFRFYLLLVEARREGAEIGLEWRAFPASDAARDRRALAAAELIRAEAPGKHGGYVQAVLAAVHLDQTAADDERLEMVAARAAGLAPDLVAPDVVDSRGAELLTATVAEARNLGVSGVPTVYRHGPAVRIKTTPAVNSGPATRRLEVIDAVLEDDGLWELTKP